MVQLSDDLTWSIVRKQNSGLRFSNKRNGPSLSREAGCLTHIPSRAMSGLANSKTVGLTHDGRKAVLTLKTKSAGSVPRKYNQSIELRTHGRGTKACGKTIIKLVDEMYYKPAVTQTALAKLALMAKAERRAAKKVTYTPKSGRSNKN